MNARREYLIQLRYKRGPWRDYQEVVGRIRARSVVNLAQDLKAIGYRFRVLARIPAKWRKVRL